jgi:hypothetical protein
MVFWVPAISQESFELAYREIGVRLGVPGITEDNADIRKLVKDALSSGSLGDWLMIVDNADDPGVLLETTDNNPMPTRLSDCLPHSSSGTILFTTRSKKVAGDLTPSSVLELNDMSKAEARQLLARRLTKQTLLDDETAVDELLAVLTYLPLAIVQAAAFINNNDISVSGYISLFRHTGTESELFSERFEDLAGTGRWTARLQRRGISLLIRYRCKTSLLRSTFLSWRASIASTFLGLYYLPEARWCSK